VGEEKCIQSFGGEPKGEDVGIDRKIIMKWILKK
jgi:hypothetical protein